MLQGMPNTCPCGMCVLAMKSDVMQDVRTVCCAADDYLLMRGNASQRQAAEAPATFARLSQVNTIQGLAQAGERAKMSWRSVYAVDPTTVFMWLLGIISTAWSTWYSATEHRAALQAHRAAPAGPAPTSTPKRSSVPVSVWQSTGAADADAELLAQDSAHTPGQADSTPRGEADSDGAQPPASGGYQGQCSTGLVIGAFVISSILLLALFFMLQAGVPIVWLLIPTFAIGATTAQVRIVWLPLFAKLQYPVLNRHAGHLHPRLKALTLRLLLAALPAIIIVVLWLVLRHTPAVFFFQNVLGALVCANLMCRLQLHEFRAVYALLGAFFVYDVFFVFLTPYIFGGDSVMVAVATAGQVEPVANPACFCRLNPGADECGDGERMPILLTLPRVGWGGGEALLGLGDIVLPGLLLSLLIRYDTEGFHGVLRGKYWIFGMVAYAVGLAAANAAVIVTGEGQPALLYIVPCIMIAAALRAWQLQELPLVWYGPIGTIPDEESFRLISGAGAGATRTATKSVQNDTVNPMVDSNDAAQLPEAGLQLTEHARMNPSAGGATTRGRRTAPKSVPVESARLLP